MRRGLGSAMRQAGRQAGKASTIICVPVCVILWCCLCLSLDTIPRVSITAAAVVEHFNRCKVSLNRVQMHLSILRFLSTMWYFQIITKLSILSFISIFVLSLSLPPLTTSLSTNCDTLRGNECCCPTAGIVAAENPNELWLKCLCVSLVMLNLNFEKLTTNTTHTQPPNNPLDVFILD